MKPASLLFLLALLSSVFAGQKPAPLEEDPLVLDPYKVSGTALSNFPIDIKVVVNPETKKVAKIVISRVKDKSEAADLGMQAGDEIVSVDGVVVAGMDPKIDRASQIGLLFLNRKPGEALKLEILPHHTRQITLHAEPLPGL
jgi:C-terminal processing protease CtpA/Prc